MDNDNKPDAPEENPSLPEHPNTVTANQPQAVADPPEKNYKNS